jgi:hypothetical protein
MDEFLYRARPWVVTLIAHNWPIMLYAVLTPWAAIYAYLRPSRRRLSLVYGLVVLACVFEYQKHAIPVLRDTTDYLFSLETNPGMRRVSQFTLLDVAPVAAYGLGLVLVAAALAPLPRQGRSDLRAGRRSTEAGCSQPVGGPRVRAAP